MIKIIIPKLDDEKTRAALNEIVKLINAEIERIDDAVKEARNNGGNAK